MWSEASSPSEQVSDQRHNGQGSPGEGRGQDTAWRTFRDVQVEEVTVQDGLDNAGHHSNEVEEALEVEAPDPVDEVQGAVEAQEEQVVGGDGLCLPGLADHEELRQDGHRLQVDGEGPQDLREKWQPHQRPRPAVSSQQALLPHREATEREQSLGIRAQDRAALQFNKPQKLKPQIKAQTPQDKRGSRAPPAPGTSLPDLASAALFPGQLPDSSNTMLLHQQLLPLWVWGPEPALLPPRADRTKDWAFHSLTAVSPFQVIQIISLFFLPFRLFLAWLNQRAKKSES